MHKRYEGMKVGTAQIKAQPRKIGAVVLRQMKTLTLAVLVWVYLSSGHLAQALNGYTNVTICNCSTTADFVTAASNASTTNHAPGNGAVKGTYTVVSTTTSRSAYVQVIGLMTVEYGLNIWVVTSAVPVNSTGASIASESESTQESFYGVLDQTLFGTNRSGPLSVNCPSNYSPTFIDALDEEVGPGIDLALSEMGVNWASLAVGTTITVKFSDGTTAQYIKTSNLTDHWAWYGIAHNKSGQPINRGGTVQHNPNTSGIGTGAVRPPVFGTGANWIWTFTLSNDCYSSSYTVLPDGTTFGGGGWGPC